MTESVWTQVVPEEVEEPSGEVADLGRWTVPADEIVIWAEEYARRMEEAAREEARTYFPHSRIGGAPRPDLSSRSEAYRQTFEDELARLAAENERGARLAAELARERGRVQGGPS